MKSLSWCTDVHLDFLTDEKGRSVDSEFIKPLSALGVDGYIITGDISVAEYLPMHLAALDTLGHPVYFVLGNHDFYGGRFSSVIEVAAEAAEESDNLVYLTSQGVVSLSERTAIVGHDGWYDGGYGHPYQSGIVMSDWVKIHDFPLAGASRPTADGIDIDLGRVLNLSRQQAEAAAQHVHQHASAAAADHELVVIVTHVPPFPEVHMFGGKGRSPHTIPWYTSRHMGEAILDLAENHRGTRFEVFCGHTHTAADVTVAPNVRCHVGASQYGDPKSHATIQLP